MKILFVNRMFSIERGGGETFDLEISRYLAAQGCDIAYLSGLPLFSGARIPEKLSQAFTVRSPYYGWFPWDKVRGGWRLRLLDFWLFERAAFRWVCRHPEMFDVLQVCELPNLARWWMSTGHRQPVVMRLTADNFYDPHGAAQKVNGLIASGMTMKKLKASFRADVADIPNGVDTSLFCPQPSDFRRRHGLTADDFVVLYVARFQAFKNHELLIQAVQAACNTCPHLKLVLAGSGPLELQIQRLCHSLGVESQVSFLGEVPFNELPAIYAAANLLAVSSVYESFCFAALEAMASALPIVTTDCGWVPQLIGCDGAVDDVVACGGGWVVPQKGPAIFARALQAAAHNASERRNKGQWNRAKAVAEHGWRSSAQKLLKLYQSLLGKETRANNAS